MDVFLFFTCHKTLIVLVDGVNLGGVFKIGVASVKNPKYNGGV